MRPERRSPPVGDGEISPLVLKRATPAHGAGDADPKSLGRRVARHAPFHHSPHDTFAKIVRKRHPRRLLRAATILKQIKADSGIPHHDSIRSETALEGMLARAPSIRADCYLRILVRR